MTTRGFEFAYNLDGTNAPPVIRDFTLGVSAAHKKGDVLVIQSDGFVDQSAGTLKEATCIMMEDLSAAQVTAEVTKAKAAIVTTNQVWRCSSDAATAATALPWAIKRLDIANARTIESADITNGSLMPVEFGGLDSAGNLIIYVVFTKPTLGFHAPA